MPKGTVFVDEAVTTAAIRYIVNQQAKSGRFPIIGSFHNSHLMVRRRVWRRKNTISVCVFEGGERTIKEGEKDGKNDRG